MTPEYVSARLACAVVEDVHIAVHGSLNPDETDWEGYLSAARKILENHTQPRVLVFTYGGNPSGLQRSQLNKINEGLSPRVAVMVNSRVARGAVTALGWFNPNLRAFSLDDMDPALEHLELAGPLAEQVRKTVMGLDEARRQAARAIG